MKYLSFFLYQGDISRTGDAVHKFDLFFRPNTSLGPLSFTFVSHRSFKFRFQIDPLSFEFVSDRSFKFIRFQIGPLSFEFVSDRSFNFGLTEVDRKDLSETNSKLKGPI